MRLGSVWHPITVIPVSIHASVKDATFSRCCLCENARGFNPRICKRCDYMDFISSENTEVSIHASVKDATIGSVYIRSRRDVSIHASVKDATSTGSNGAKETSFNPRICKRCDLISIPKSQPPLYVSIHASVKDATPCL